jgi:hypothetical protein
MLATKWQQNCVFQLLENINIFEFLKLQAKSGKEDKKPLQIRKKFTFEEFKCRCPRKLNKETVFLYQTS